MQLQLTGQETTATDPFDNVHVFIWRAEPRELVPDAKSHSNKLCGCPNSFLLVELTWEEELMSGIDEN